MHFTIVADNGFVLHVVNKYLDIVRDFFKKCCVHEHKYIWTSFKPDTDHPNKDNIHECSLLQRGTQSLTVQSSVIDKAPLEWIKFSFDIFLIFLKSALPVFRQISS